MIKSEVKKIVWAAVQKSFPNVTPFAFDVDEPASQIDADLASNVCFPLAKQVQSSPAKAAESLASRIDSGGPIIKKIEVSKNGFLNLFLTEKYVCDVAAAIYKNGENALGAKTDPAKPKVLIEFVSANPTGPLHIGHGRGAALGDSLARIYRQCGYDVRTEYYVNDMGVQMGILAESVRARFLELEGKTDAFFPENGYKGEYVFDIARAMKAQNRHDFIEFPKEYLLDVIRKDLEDFRVTFHHWFHESTLHQNKKVEEVLEFLKSKGSLKEKDGALWFVPPGYVEPEKKEGEDERKSAEIEQQRVLRKSDGRYTYFAADIAYHKTKLERGFGHCIDIWGHDHHGYVPRMESSISALGYPKDALKILLYQLVSLKRGGEKVAMSTRAGQFVTLREILDEVGPDACRFFFAMRSPTSNLEFDVDLAKKQSNENPVFYVQYVFARIASIFREAEKRGIAFQPPEKIDSLMEKAELELMKKLGIFNDILEACAQVHSPHLLATYLIDCATRFHKFYDSCRVLDAEPQKRNERLALMRATQTVVKFGLSLLGVDAPEKM